MYDAKFCQNFFQLQMFFRHCDGKIIAVMPVNGGYTVVFTR